MVAAAAADDGTSGAAVSVTASSSSTARVVEIDHSGHPQQRSKRKLYRSNAKLGVGGVSGESFQVKQMSLSAWNKLRLQGHVLQYRAALKEPSQVV